MNFNNRSSQEELMDTEAVTYEQFHECLHELEVINHLTLAYTPTLRWLGKILKNTKQDNISILDVGSGGGDMLRHIWKCFGKSYKQIVLTGVDINPWSKKAADSWSKNLPIQHETSDIFKFDPQRRVDFIISGLFTHHLSNDQLIKFTQWMEQHSIQGWFINDLHRHAIPYYFIKIATRVFSRNHLIINDAAVSVSRAFTRADWLELLQIAGIPSEQTRIRWHFPFRYCVERYK